MKKYVWLILAVVLAVMLAACSSDPSTPTAGETQNTAATGDSGASDPTGEQTPGSTETGIGTGIGNGGAGTGTGAGVGTDIGSGSGTGTGTGTGGNNQQEPAEPTVGVDTETEPTAAPGESKPDNVIDFDDLLNAGKG